MNNKIDSFTLLRGFALISVVGFHMYPDIVKGGFLSVIIFFVLSGFLMMKKIDSKSHLLSVKDTVSFIKTRLFKLLPPLYFAIGVALLFAYFFAEKVFADSIDNLPSLLLGYDNIYQIFQNKSYFNKHGSYYLFTHIWTMCVQLQFIVVFMILNFFVSKFKLKKITRVVFFFLMGASMLYMTYMTYQGEELSWIYYFTFTRVGALFLGANFYLFVCKKIDIFKKYNYVAMDISKYLIILFMITSFLLVDGNERYVYLYFMHIFSLLAGILITILYIKEKTQISIGENPFSNTIKSILMYLGDRSYHIYIWQYIVGEFCKYNFVSLELDRNVVAVLELVTVWIISEGSYRLFGKIYNSKKYLSTGILAIILLISAVIFLPDKNIAKDKELEKSIIENQKNIEIQNQKVLKKNIIDEENASHIDEMTDSERIREEKKYKLEYLKEEQKRIKEEQEKIEKERKKREQINQEKNQKSQEMTTAKTPENTSSTEIQDDRYGKKQLEFLSSLSVTCVGDSVIINADPYLRAKIPNLYLDGKVSRQLTAGVDVLKYISDNYGLGEVVLISLGTNGDFNIKYLSQIREICGDRTVIFINCVMPEYWESSVNQKISDFVSQDTGSYLVDWYSYAKSRQDIFYKDMTHPKPDGAKIYANLILDKILEIYGK